MPKSLIILAACGGVALIVCFAVIGKWAFGNDKELSVITRLKSIAVDKKTMSDLDYQILESIEKRLEIEYPNESKGFVVDYSRYDVSIDVACSEYPADTDELVAEFLAKCGRKNRFDAREISLSESKVNSLWDCLQYMEQKGFIKMTTKSGRLEVSLLEKQKVFCQLVSGSMIAEIARMFGKPRLMVSNGGLEFSNAYKMWVTTNGVGVSIRISPQHIYTNEAEVYRSFMESVVR